MFFYLRLSSSPSGSKVTHIFLAPPFFSFSSFLIFLLVFYINLSSPSSPPSKEIRKTCDGILTLSGTIWFLYLPLNRLTHTQKYPHTHKLKHTCHTCSNSCHTLGCPVNAVIFSSLAVLIPVRKRVCVSLGSVFVFCVISSCLVDLYKCPSLSHCSLLFSLSLSLPLLLSFSPPLLLLLFLSRSLSLSLSLVPLSPVSYCVCFCVWMKSSLSCL